MTQQHRFLVALKTLQDWYADSVKARDYNSPATSSSKPGSTHLRIQRYPSTAAWLARWRSAGDAAAQERVVEAIEDELLRLSYRAPTLTYRDYWGKTRYRTVTA